MSEPVRYTTLLDGLAVTMRLGIHPQEATPQRVIVSVRMTVAYPAPVAEDRIDQVLDYDFVRERILGLAAERPFALQETLCDAIAALCLADPRVEEVEVRTAKPDVYPDAAVGCMVTRRRDGRGEMADKTASELIDARIAELGDWRGTMLARLRGVVRRADPEVVEEWKWRGVPTWSHAGILCTGETYKAVVKMTFAHGAALDDPAGLFNASLEGNVRRAIDWREGDEVDEAALADLIRAAVAYNMAKKR